MQDFTPYSIKATLTLSFEEAKAKTVEAFKAQGFGLLTEIDMRAKLKEKLDAEIPDYAILGLCAPGLAYRAWQEDPHVGVLLPCTVVVRAAEDGTVEVLIEDPDALVQFSPGITAVLDDVKAKVQAALAALQDG
jgi:uncharacterized protein (DUF302 family)